MSASEKGIVYILTNAAMPGYVKIGLTRNNDVALRVRQLDTTGVPLPFEVYFAANVPDCNTLERTLHFVFGEGRARKNREFFKINPDLAKAIIELVATDPIEYSDEEQAIDVGERQEIETAKKRREVRTFSVLGLQPGAMLTFTKDSSITCTVIGNRKVIFEGEEMSPSAAALKAVHSLGYTWPAVSGMAYWAYNGIRLSDLTSADDDDEDLIG